MTLPLSYHWQSLLVRKTTTLLTVLVVAAARQFAGLRIGDSIHLGYCGDRAYEIVGYFSTGGGPLEHVFCNATL